MCVCVFVCVFMLKLMLLCLRGRTPSDRIYINDCGSQKLWSEAKLKSKLDGDRKFQENIYDKTGILPLVL